METAINKTIQTIYTPLATQTSLFTRFLNWCNNQNENRYGWLGVAVASHGCLFTPLTMFAIIMSGNNIVLWLFAIIAMMMTLVTNLAALPTKITIPVFLFSVLLDVTVVVVCAMSGFDITTTYQ